MVISFKWPLIFCPLSRPFSWVTISFQASQHLQAGRSSPVRDPELFAHPTMIAVTLVRMSTYVLFAGRRHFLKSVVPSESSSPSALAPSPALAPLHVTVDFLFLQKCKLPEDEHSLFHLAFLTFTFCYINKMLH